MVATQAIAIASRSCKGVVFLKIRLYLFLAVLCITNGMASARVTQSNSKATSSADAALPPGTNLDRDKATVVKTNDKRSQISLDGIWRFIPASEGRDVPD